MAVTLIGSGVSASSSDGGNSVTTGSYDTTGANFIVAIVSADSAATDYTVTDNKSNGNATQAVREPVAGLSAIWFWANPTVGSGHTFSVNKVTNKPFPAIDVYAFSGMATASVLDGTQVNSAFNAGTTSLATGSVTPSANGYLVIAGLGSDGAILATIDSGFTTPVSLPFVGGNAYQLSSAYLIQGTAGAVNPLWQWVNSAGSCATIAVFKAAASGGTTLTPAAGAAVFSGIAPGLISGLVRVPTNAVLTLSGAAPSVLTQFVISPSKGSLSFSGLSPAVLTGFSVVPGAGALTLLGASPSISTVVYLTPAVASLLLSGSAPTLAQSRLMVPVSGVMSLQGYVPTISFTGFITLTPADAQLLLTGKVPSLAVPVTFSNFASVIRLPERRAVFILDGSTTSVSV